MATVEASGAAGSAAWPSGSAGGGGSARGSAAFAIDFNVAVGRLLVAQRARRRDEFAHVMTAVRLDVMRALGVASMQSYERAYPHLVRLHMLVSHDRAVMFSMPTLAWRQSEIEQLDSGGARAAVATWPRRFRLTRALFATREPLLCLRKTL